MVVPFQNWRLQRSSLTALFEYSQHRKVKATLAEKARGHLVKNVLGRIFPWWFAKVGEVFVPCIGFCDSLTQGSESVPC